MRFKCLVISILIMLCLSYPIFCQEVITPFEETFPAIIRNRFSIGINKLPWDATSISFRWWKSIDNGHEFLISGIEGLLSDDYYELDYSANISGIRYYWLRRKKYNNFEDLYITRGYGIGTGLIYSRDKEYDREFERISLSFSLRFPFGIEHFFLSKYPNVSYSLEADFYSSLGYEYIYRKNEERINKTHVGRIRFGVNPSFYFRFYF